MRRTVTPWVLVAFVLLLSGSGLLAQHGGPAYPAGGIHPGHAPSFSGASHGAAPTFSPPGVDRHGHVPSWTPTHHQGDARQGGEHRHAPANFYGGYFPFASYGYGVPLSFGPTYLEGQEASEPQAASPQPEPPAVDYGPEGERPQVATNASHLFRPAYQAQADIAPVYPQPVTTLIFKDGRPPAQVRNYALTASTLYVLDGEPGQEIPLSTLNVPSTVQANRAAGVDFALPVSR